ncbi:MULTISPECIES: hypothetical protein [Mameliella]|uniref:hypothetical protein n=1 Tax=Mameliella TaxID=1434019 RepID=UPI000B530489|nr:MULTISPECIES: hypothetical protein [Mameliella]OWV40317.1 hypothetical protein CDZ95_22485 [Mameliella alba]OWV58869.1 hypothetical protein CDZ97_20680 [Mameliella alba]
MKNLTAAILPLLAAGCASVAELDDAPAFIAAANPVAVAPAHPAPSVDYAQHRIEEPADWRGLNDAQSGANR